jgi:hypothetical protein
MPTQTFSKLCELFQKEQEHIDMQMRSLQKGTRHGKPTEDQVVRRQPERLEKTTKTKYYLDVVPFFLQTYNYHLEVSLPLEKIHAN